MEVRVVSGSITEIESDALIVNLFEGITSPGGATGAVDNALEGAISRMIADGEIKGKLMETALLHTNGRISPKKVLIAGLGKAEDFDLIAAGKASGAAARCLKKYGVKSITSIVHGAGIGGLDIKEAARATVLGAVAGVYDGDLHKSKKEDGAGVESFTVVELGTSRIPAVQAGAREGEILGQAVNDARNLGNESPNNMTPTILAEKAADTAAQYGLGIDILSRQDMEREGMGGILAVAKGSLEEPALIILRYTTDSSKPTLALVGKGLTFDSGGISIKPSEHMGQMKFDMTGGAAVIQAMRAIAEIKPGINVMGLIPATENMVDGGAYRPGDVIKTMNGKTVEITTTDAEGRMILCDAITYAVKQGADYLVDIATLTGGCVVALGNDITGVMGNNKKFTDDLMKTAASAGERVWELPLPKDYMDMLKSTIADFTNAGGRWGSAIQGGLFLQEFTDGKPWVHLDIAGPAYTPDNSDQGYRAAGATGVGIATMVLLAAKMAENLS
ncbi:MAG: leucyl aminopeptidase [Armatimonadota bacterium]